VQNSDDLRIEDESKGAEDVQYEPRGHIPGVGYKKNGRKEWTPVMVSSQGTNGKDSMAYFNKSTIPYPYAAYSHNFIVLQVPICHSVA